jgi:hypothetical protein
LPPEAEPPEPPWPVPPPLSDEQPYTARPSTKNGTANLIDITDAPCQMDEERTLTHLFPSGKMFVPIF